MHGQLTSRSVADVCRELADAGATGVLHIAGFEAAGRLVFDQGRLVAAGSPTPGSRLGDRLVNGGMLEEQALDRVLEEQTDRPEGERPRLGQLLVDRGLVPLEAVREVVQEQLLDAVFDLTSWRDGTFRFESDAEPDTPEVPLAVTVDQALVEASRRREEWEALSEVIPDLDAVPRFREGASSSMADLEPDEFAVLASVDGDRSVRDLAYDLGYGEFEAARVVYALNLLGLVEVELPTDEIGAALDDALAYVGGQPTSGAQTEAPPSIDDEPAPRQVPGDADEAPAPSPAPADDEPAPWDAPTADDDEPAPWDAPGADDEPAAHQAPADDEPAPWDAPTADDDEPAPRESAEDEPAAATPAASGTEEPGEHQPPADLEADLPDLSAFDDLDLPGDEEATAGDAAASQDDRAAPAEASPPHDAEGGFFGTPPPQPPASPSGDVSEFLRELSRLALDDEEETGDPAASESSSDPAPQPPPRPRPSPPREEPKRKKRGLFGFGG